MPLSDEDTQRIEGMGYSNFFEIVGSEKRLRNINKVCFFLNDGKCKIYEDRPEGCQLYPLIINEKSDYVGLDGDCPHIDEFEITPKKITKLQRLMKRINGQSSYDSL